MKPIYQSEHLNCLNYSKDQNQKINQIDLLEGKDWEALSTKGIILFILEGELEFSFGFQKEHYINKRHMIFLPLGLHFKAKAISDSKVIVLYGQEKLQFCNCYQIKDLIEHSEIDEKEENLIHEDKEIPFLLQIRRPLWLLLEQLSECLSAQLRCSHYLDTKIKEIFYMYQGFYSKKELALFFSPTSHLHPDFTEYVYANYNQFETVTEFAQSLDCTPADFEKRFFKAFGISAQQWMTEQKIKNIFHEINTGTKKIKEISEEFHFSSPSVFNDFCKKHLNATPGEIRKNKSYRPNK